MAGVLKAGRGRARLLKVQGGGSITHGALLQALLRRAHVEVQVRDGVRPEWIACGACGDLVKVRAACGVPRFCSACRVGRAQEKLRSETRERQMGEVHFKAKLRGLRLVSVPMSVRLGDVLRALNAVAHRDLKPMEAQAWLQRVPGLSVEVAA